jgi:hypothetical protein
MGFKGRGPDFYIPDGGRNIPTTSRDWIRQKGVGTPPTVARSSVTGRASLGRRRVCQWTLPVDVHQSAAWRVGEMGHSGGPSGQCTRASTRPSRVAGNAAHMAGDLRARDGSAQGGRDVGETAKGGPTGERKESGPTRELFGPTREPPGGLF